MQSNWNPYTLLEGMKSGTVTFKMVWQFLSRLTIHVPYDLSIPLLVIYQREFVLIQMKNAFHGLIRKLDTAKERASELEERSRETYHTANAKRKSKAEVKPEQNMQEPWFNGERSTTPSTGLSEKGENGVEELFQVTMARNFSILMAAGNHRSRSPREHPRA